MMIRRPDPRNQCVAPQSDSRRCSSTGKVRTAIGWLCLRHNDWYKGQSKAAGRRHVAMPHPSRVRIAARTGGTVLL